MTVNIGEGFIKAASEDEVLNKALRDKLTDKAVVKEGRLCPECKEPLSEVLYEGAPILKCHFCGGVLTKHNNVIRIMVREDFSFSPSIEEIADALVKEYSEGKHPEYFRVTYQLDCPNCGIKMSRGFFSYVYPVEVDRCYKCENIWFNKDELELIQYIFEKKGKEGNQKIFR